MSAVEKNYRHEYKYLISASSAMVLRARLPHFMHRDAHAGADGRYTIRSLYFDDQVFTAFYDKAAGVDDRIKYRIRCYDHDTAFIRLERKEKRGDLTRKTGQTITLADALALQRRDPEGCPDNPQGLTAELVRQFGAGMAPKVLVDYDRTSFVCSSGNTRITLDENLRTRPYCGDLLAPSHPMFPVLEPDQVVLEVKFDDFLPGYLSDVLGDIPKAHIAVSKFALCLNLI